MLDDELRALMQVVPPPGFEARVRSRVSAAAHKRPAARWMFWWWMSAGAAAAGAARLAERPPGLATDTDRGHHGHTLAGR